MGRPPRLVLQFSPLKEISLSLRLAAVSATSGTSRIPSFEMPMKRLIAIMVLLKRVLTPPAPAAMLAFCIAVGSTA
jgi:hypothetical protein